MTFRLSLRSAALGALGSFLSLPALAHPHVWVTAHEDVLFDPNGRVSGIRHNWTFDDMYSAFLVQGIGAPGEQLSREQLAPLAQTNVDSLVDFAYFTVVKAGGKQGEFDKPVDYWLEQGKDKILTLHFTLPLKNPVAAFPALTLAVYDPTYFVSFSMADKDPVRLTSAPSGGPVAEVVGIGLA